MYTEKKIEFENQKHVLVVTDMIKGFITEGALSDPYIQQIVPSLTKVMDAFIEHNQPILAFLDTHSEDSLEFKSYPKHCLRDQSESELIEELKPYQEKMILMEKDTTNGFLCPKFQEYLPYLRNIDSIIITGCCTDICILQFALTLKCYFNQEKLDIEVIVPKVLVDTFETYAHMRGDFNHSAFLLMANANITVVDDFWIGSYHVE